MINKELSGIREVLVLHQDLGKAMSMMRSYLKGNNLKHINAAFDEIESNYVLMKDFMLNGYDDPQRNDIYNGMVVQMYELCNNAIIAALTQSVQTYINAFSQSRMVTNDPNEIKRELESFVQEVALVTLETDEQVRSAKTHEIYRKHQDFSHKLFCSILVSRQWSDSERDFMSQLLTSPTIDTNDIRLLISAVMLSCMTVFDHNKFLSLIHVFKNTTDLHVSQRALVAIALNMPEGEENIYTDLNDVIKALLEPKTCKQLTELQIQILYCMNADADAETIKSDVMPNLMKSDLSFTRAGITEKEEDIINDIIHSGEANEKMEKMEKSLHEMMEMQKRGSDIYFGGFSQMKRFPFFYTISNWFCPFFLEHPGLKTTTKELDDSTFLKAILKKGPFCDSDKYSFALYMSTIINKLPENMKEMLKNESIPEFSLNNENINNPSYIRRMYLQDLYRFFRLFPANNDFVSPFSMENKKCLFVGNMSIIHSAVRLNIHDIISFFIKHKVSNKYMTRIIDLYVSEDEDDMELRKLKAVTLLHNKNYDMAFPLLLSLSSKMTDDIQILESLAKAAYNTKHYDIALDCFNKLISRQPQKKYYLGKAVLLVDTKKIDEGMEILYRLVYEYPSDVNVMRTIAWGYLLKTNKEKALYYYDKILKTVTNNPSDYLNCGYAKWLSKDIKGAVDMFKSFLKLSKDQVYNDRDILEKEFMTDHEVLRAYGLKESDIYIMIDLCTAT